MADKKPFYITTAISYPNGEPHIGHAYEVVAADAIARFMRLDGRDVFFMTGTDEHGLKIQQTATKAGTTPRAYVDRMAVRFEEMGRRLSCSFDRFIRTTDPDHYASVQELWRRIKANGDIYLGEYSGWYSVRDEAYFDEGELTTQPDGTRLAPTGSPVEWIDEKSYFFRLSAYQDKLLAHYEANPDFIAPTSRRNEIVAFVKRGLEDLSISRTTFDWGVPVPDDPDHVMYVWIDALTNYLSGTGFPDPDAPRARYWPADLHVIGKDITRFHTVYWPAFLMSAGLELPKRVFGHGFLLVKGEKMSKSVGNVVDPFNLAETYGVDQIRYFFLREVPFGQDGSYSPEGIANRINADLANDLGNLAQRSLSMIAKNCAGEVPACGDLTDADREILAAADALPEKARAAMERFAIHAMLADVWAVVGDANRYFASHEPWALRKTDPARMETVLWVTIEVLRAVGIAAEPAIPSAAAKLLDLLGVPADRRRLADVGEGGRLAAGAPLPAPAPIFPRYIAPETVTE